MAVETVVAEVAVEVVVDIEVTVVAEVVMVVDTEEVLHEKVAAEMIAHVMIDLERIVLPHQDHMPLEMVPQHHEVMLQEQIAGLQGLQEVTSNQAVAHAVKQVVKQDALLEVVVAVAVAREDASLLNDGVRQSRPHTPLF